MNCKNCYQEIPDGSKFCPHCGAKQNEVQPNAEQENAVKNDPVQATGAAKTTENATGYQDAAGYQNNSGYQDASPAQATFSTSSSTASTVPVSTLAVPTKRAT